MADKVLKVIVERIERLEEQKADIAVDIGEVYQEAKNKGYDTKAIRRLIKVRKDPQEAQRIEDLVTEYSTQIEFDFGHAKAKEPEPAE
jgi:uncharacterized protein (UPF0335 family)